MRTRKTGIFAFIGLLVAFPAAAQQPADQKPQDTQQSSAQPTATMASAADLRLPAQGARASEATEKKKPRAARVTTCRCGGDTVQR